MVGVPVYFRLKYVAEDYAFRRLTVLPRVGETVVFLGKLFKVLVVLHEFKRDADEQNVFISIEESA